MQIPATITGFVYISKENFTTALNTLHRYCLKCTQTIIKNKAQTDKLTLSNIKMEQSHRRLQLKNIADLDINEYKYREFDAEDEDLKFYLVHFCPQMRMYPTRLMKLWGSLIIWPRFMFEAQNEDQPTTTIQELIPPKPRITPPKDKQIANLKSRIQELQVELHQKNQFKEITNSIPEKINFENQHDNWRDNEIKNLQERINTLEAEVKELKNQHEKLQQDHAKQITALAVMEERVKGYQQTIADNKVYYENQIKELKAKIVLEKTCDEAFNDFRDNFETIGQLFKDTEVFENKITKLNEHIEKNSEENSKIKNENSTLITERDNITRQQDELQAANRKLNAELISYLQRPKTETGINTEVLQTSDVEIKTDLIAKRTKLQQKIQVKEEQKKIRNEREGEVIIREPKSLPQGVEVESGWEYEGDNQNIYLNGSLELALDDMQANYWECTEISDWLVNKEDNGQFRYHFFVCRSRNMKDCPARRKVLEYNLLNNKSDIYLLCQGVHNHRYHDKVFR